MNKELFEFINLIDDSEIDGVAKDIIFSNIDLLEREHSSEAYNFLQSSLRVLLTSKIIDEKLYFRYSECFQRIYFDS